MIKIIEKPSKSEEIIGLLDKDVEQWFFSKFKEFSLPQLYALMPIFERKNILISAPTGGTKTLTAFLPIINYLVTLAKKQELENKVYCVYVSPLKALNNDIFFNLITPLKEIEEIVKKKQKMQEIRIKVRTGDTTQEDKQKMLKEAPHILVTTPETLAIVLSSKKFIEKLRGVEFVIVDEIHALANKRGTHLSLSLERLQHASKIVPVRIGLSATVAPLEEMAKFLVGFEKKGTEWKPRDCLIADVQFLKKMDLKVLSPLKDMIDTNAKEMKEGLYGLLDKLIQEHKTTLIFTNTRSATERVIAHLKEMFPHRYEALEESIGAHHSSLSRAHRFSIEQKLREGKLKAVVSSTSLELGIDIGYIDLVILLGSPKSVARALQRIGRAGHRLHETSKGRLIVLDQDDLIECAVLLKEALEKRIDKVEVPKNALDVLAQHIFGMAIQQKWNINEMFDLIRRSYCFNSLSKEDFLSVISYLAGEYNLEAKQVYAKIWYDPETKEIGRRGKLARMIYMTNIGTIPEESFVNVIIASPSDRKNEKVGVIDETFLERLKRDDVFVLGGNRYQFLYARGMNAYVNASVQKPPTIPSWISEMLPLSFDLALAIQRFRALMEELFKKKKSKQEIKQFIMKYLYVDQNACDAIYNYFYEQFHYAGIPHEKKLLLEHYVDEQGKIYYIFHSLYGRRVNDALSRAIAYIASRRDVELGINDNGFFLASFSKLQVEKALRMLAEKPEQLRYILEEAIEKTEVFRRRFRHCATRALMILRSYKGKSKTVGRQQLKSDLLYYAIKKISEDFPIIRETKREILEDLMDLKNAEQVLKWIKEGKIKVESIKTEVPSPFALNLVTQGYADLMRIENKILFLKRMYEKIREKIKRKGY
ncbi:MAG: ATP-dependent helicase [Candidatus Pacearchaeota archaeon]